VAADSHLSVMLAGYRGGEYGKAGGADQKEQNQMKIGLDMQSPIPVKDFKIE